MEKELRFILVLSLEEIALRRIAVMLYNDPHILASIANFELKPHSATNIWFELKFLRISKKIHLWRDAVKGKLLELNLPEWITNNAMPILKAVGTEIFKWKNIHKEYLNDSNCDLNVRVLQKLCWTTAGTIDYKKSAEEIVCGNVLDIGKCFELSCLYLEDYIPLVWEELPEEGRKTFSEKEVKTPCLQLFLPRILKKHSGLQKLPSKMSAEKLFQYAALMGNKTLTEYCFRMLLEQKRGAALIKTTKEVIKCRNSKYPYTFAKEKLSDMVCYLLSLMTYEEQIEIFEKLPCEVLRCFLDWPWQDFFSDVAEHVWTFLPENKYMDFWYLINNCVVEMGFYFPTFFQKLFQRSPFELRKCFVFEQKLNVSLFWKFFTNEDRKTVQVIFKNVDAEHRVRLVFSERGLNFIYHWLLHKWPMLEFFLREAMLAKEDKEKLKGALLERLQRDGRIDGAMEEYREFFEFVEETDALAESKRTLEGGDIHKF